MKPRDIKFYLLKVTQLVSGRTRYEARLSMLLHPQVGPQD